jgi:hypothetical protein
LKIEESDNIPCDVAPKVKKPRKKRNTVQLDSPGQTEMPVGNIDAEGKITPIDAVAEHDKGSQTVAEIAEALLVPMAPAVAPQPIAIPAAEAQAAVSPEKAKEYSERLKKYSQDILLKGGMQPSEKIGGVTMKLRKFATVHSGVEGSQKMTEAQFESLLSFLDSYTAANGPAGLVNYINEKLGVA